MNLVSMLTLCYTGLRTKAIDLLDNNQEVYG
jgi:hypothetical protein